MKLMLLFVNLTFGADAATTSYGLKHGATEVMIPSQNVLVLDAIASGEAVSASLGLIKLNKTHPRMAKIFSWSLICARSAVVYHNANEIRR